MNLSNVTQHSIYCTWNKSTKNYSTGNLKTLGNMTRAVITRMLIVLLRVLNAWGWAKLFIELAQTENLYLKPIVYVCITYMLLWNWLSENADGSAHHDTDCKQEDAEMEVMKILDNRRSCIINSTRRGPAICIFPNKASDSKY